MSIAFLVTTLIVVATPGTGVVYTLSAALSRGTRASMLAAFACTLGIVPQMLATITGLAALLHTSAVAFEVVKYLGVAYLLWMAWSTLRDTSAIEIPAAAGAPSTGRVLLTGVLLNLLNPKLTIFFVAFLPQFVPAGDPNSVLRMLALSGVFMLLTFVVFALYGVGAARVRRYVITRPRVVTWIRRTFAGTFLALGATLAAASR